MNYRPLPNNINLANEQGERIIPLLTGFALGAPFWGGIGRQNTYQQPYYYPYYYPYPYPYPYSTYNYYNVSRPRRPW